MKSLRRIGLQVSLALVLVLSLALGSALPVAQAAVGNKVDIEFNTGESYATEEDSVNNVALTGSWKSTSARIENVAETPAPTGQTVVAPKLTFTPNAGVTVDTTTPAVSGPPYVWTLANVDEGKWQNALARIDAGSFTFTPGFSASRSFNQTLFTASGTQVLTINATPAETMGELRMMVRIQPDDLVDATIPTAPTPTYTGEVIKLSDDKKSLDIRIPTPGTQAYTKQVNINVNLNSGVTSATFKPRVNVMAANLRGSGDIAGATVPSMSPPILGTWQCQTGLESYSWHWSDWQVKSVTFQEILRNRVNAGFRTYYQYSTTDNTVDTRTTTQPVQINSWLTNDVDSTGQIVQQPVVLNLSKGPGQTVTDVKQDYFVTGSTYQWRFPDIPEDTVFSGWARLGQTATFTTGFDVSRSVNLTTTTFPPAGGTQTLTLNVTPREAMARLDINLSLPQVMGKDIATITTATGPGSINIPTGKHRLNVSLNNPTANPQQPYTWIITIQVGPLPADLPQVNVDFMPLIEVNNTDILNSKSGWGNTWSGQSLQNSTVLGIWTWTATKDYSWRWEERSSKQVRLEGRANLLVNKVYTNSRTDYTYRTAADSVDNPTTSQYTSMNSYLSNQPDGLGDVVSPAVELSTTRTVASVGPSENLVSGPPSPYRWEFLNTPENGNRSAWANLSEVVQLSTGFSASRSVNQNRFPPSGGTQTLTVKVTPKVAMLRLEVHGNTKVDNLAVATVDTVSGTGISKGTDGTSFHVTLNNLTANQLYEWQITIQIGALPAGYKALEYMPQVQVQNIMIFNSGSFSGNSLSRRSLDKDAAVLGDWTWTATGNYSWSWEEKVSKQVNFEGYAMHSYPLAPTQDTVNLAIDKGLTWLRTQQQPDGSWLWGRPARPNSPAIEDKPNVGMAGLAVLSLLRDDVPATDPDVADGISYLVSRQVTNPASNDYGAICSADRPQRVYETAIAILALRATNNSAYLDEIALAANYLAKAQNDEGVVYPYSLTITPDYWAYGGWGYNHSSVSTTKSVGGENVPTDPYVWADLSNSQYAMIALKAAQEAGAQLTLPETWAGVWAKAQVFLARTQNPDGGFIYQPVAAPGDDGSSYGAMTAGGVWALRLSGLPANDPKVQAGLAWLDSYPYYDRNPRSNQYHYYFLWSAAKAFALCGRPAELNPGTWYYDYAGYLVAYQDASGRWVNPVWPEGESDLNATLYALLVLEKVVLLPPVAEAGGPYLVQVGSEVTLNGSDVSDPPRQITGYTWDFGDLSGQVEGTGNPAPVKHSYAATGMYLARFTVTDYTGGEGSDTAWVIVYDPAAGFATGGGWFIPTSAKGDKLPGLDDKSPAEFGFVVKYTPGATTPSGQLEFQYHQGNINLHSSGMEWLVIVNNNWAKFRGTATIKGMEGSYRFSVEARDGSFGGGKETDYFIIKVWAPGKDPDKDNLTYKAEGDLGGGNIVIHTK